MGIGELFEFEKTGMIEKNSKMDEWIDNLKENAAVKRANELFDGDLYGVSPHIACYSKLKHINLSGSFTPEQLEALIKHMRRYQK
jgi:hypothetical protein